MPQISVYFSHPPTSRWGRYSSERTLPFRNFFVVRSTHLRTAIIRAPSVAQCSAPKYPPSLTRSPVNFRYIYLFREQCVQRRDFTGGLSPRKVNYRPVRAGYYLVSGGVRLWEISPAIWRSTNSNPIGLTKCSCVKVKK